MLGTNIGNFNSTGINAGKIALTTDSKFYAVTNFFSGANPGSGTGVLKRYNSSGEVDSTFDAVTVTSDIGFFVPGTINDLDVLSDGSILIAGSFTGVNGLPRANIARLDPVGTVDPTFATSFPSVLDRIVAMPDGRIMVGTSIRIFRLLADGSVDTSYDSPTVVGILGWELDSSGRFVLHTETTLVRLSSDGSVELSVPLNPGLPADVTAADAYSGGRVVFAGDFLRVNGTDRRSVARVEPDGRVDAGFNAGNGFNGAVSKLIVQPDGKVLSIGDFTFVNGSPRRAVARLNVDGSVDGSFAPDIPGGSVRSIELQPDGKVIVGGNFTSVNGQSRTGLARLEANGTLDASFAPLIGTPNIEAITVLTDGRIMIAGTFSGVNGSGRINIARLNADGSLDTAFNALSPATTTMTVRQVEPVDDGRYLVLTNTLVRLANGGAIDPTFTSPNITGSGGVKQFLVLADSSILIGGSFTSVGGVARSNLARLWPSGSVDTNFIPAGANGAINTLAYEHNGSVIVGGAFTSIGGVFRPSIARLTIGLTTPRTNFDFDGDGRADQAVFRPANGFWYELRSQDASFYALQFGQQGDRIGPGDYDGDGKTDVGVFRDTVPGAGTLGYFYITNSSEGSITTTQFGSTGDVPVTGDWDGDGKADLAVYRAGAQSAFYYRPSGSPGVDFRQIVWGTAGDRPLVGDFDGDGKLDAAVFRPSNANWYILRSSDGQFIQLQFGVSTDIPLAADFDGNGTTKIAVYRPSTGAWYTSTDPQTNYGYVQFGTSEDLPVPADYDGDGRADVAVFRPSTGAWYMLRSTAGFTGVQFGASGDKPIPNAFVP